MPSDISTDGIPNAVIALDRMIKREMKCGELLGLTAGVVAEGQTVFEKGYGIRDAKQSLKVTSDTLFSIGSTGKAFTAMLAALLVDDGVLDLDCPVIEYIPGFKLYDKYATQHVTLRDMLSHRTGLPRHDFVWWETDHSRQELFRRLRYLKPTKGFREEFQYNNLMFMAAGVVFESISGLSWEELIQQRIFDPLGMNQAKLFEPTLFKKANIAKGHRYSKKIKRFIPEAPNHLAALAPAGMIFLNAADMCKWMLFHLNKGKLGRKKLISGTALKQLWSPNIGTKEFFGKDQAKEVAYGLGWFIREREGLMTLEHGGYINQTYTYVTLIPEKGVGIFISATGQELGSIVSAHALHMAAIQKILGVRVSRWKQRIHKSMQKAKEVSESAEQKMKDSAGLAAAPHSLELQAYTGDYQHPAYGLIQIKVSRNGLHCIYGKEKLHLYHLAHEKFTSSKSVFLEQSHSFEFRLGKSGNVSSILVCFEESFVRFKAS